MENKAKIYVRMIIHNEDKTISHYWKNINDENEQTYRYLKDIPTMTTKVISYLSSIKSYINKDGLYIRIDEDIISVNLMKDFKK
jgi:hypothetical protein